MNLAASLAPPSAVLDTNVVLDLWLFQDVRAQPLRAALQTGQLHALVSDATLAELADVLRRPFTRDWSVPPEAVLAALNTCSRAVPAQAGQGPHSARAPRCSDADDQKFIDLAWHAPATWLFSRDRAVLKLARAARAHGLRIAPPEAWTPAQQT